MQELRASQDEIDSLAVWAASGGDNTRFKYIIGANPGLLRPSMKHSGGVAILAKSYIGIARYPVAPALEQHRAVAARIDVPGALPFVAVASYCHTGVSVLDEPNRSLFAEMGQFLCSLAMPFIMGSDMQNSASDIAASMYPEMTHAVLLSDQSGIGTCKNPRGASSIGHFSGPRRFCYLLQLCPR